MTRISVISIALSVLSMIGTGSAEGRKHKATLHVVERGQTLWGISRAHGCKVTQIKEANHLGNAIIRPGQKLKIPRCSGTPKASGSKKSSGDSLILTHYVMKGDNLGRIAKRYDTSVKDIRRRNRLKGNLIRPGQKLRVAVGSGGKGRAIAGQSVGSPSHGRLENGMQLPPGRGYYRRRPHRAWGANHTIFHVRRAVAAVRGRFPKIHKVAIGDISRRKGGKVAQHKSHQSGRDVDIGLYFKKRPKGYPRSFVKATGKNLDFKATWTLLKAFADTASSSSGVEKMFLNYELQEVLYKWAEKRGVSKKTLRKMFQYPNGKHAGNGIIRHDPGHDSHVHVRFKCPKGDKDCR